MKKLIIIIFLIQSYFSYSQNDTILWDNGNIKTVTEKFADASIVKSYFNSGQLKELNINVTGPHWVYHESYCENGQLIKAYNPNSNYPMFVREYLCDGTISMEYYRSRKGYREQFIVYHKNGQIAEKGNYEASSNPIGEQKIGLWESFTPEGKKFYEAFYEGGEIIKEQKFE